MNQSWDLVDTQDMQGTLRLVRTGANETAYYLSKGNWVAIHTGTAPGQAQLGIQVFAMANDWTRKQIRVAFDNYGVTASAITCP